MKSAHALSFVIGLSNCVKLQFKNKFLQIYFEAVQAYNLKRGVHVRLKSRLEIGADASSIVNLGYYITDDYCNRT